jgi:hypothetical protein
VLFGAYDGYDIVSFDDQVGEHGSAGGDEQGLIGYVSHRARHLLLPRQGHSAYVMEFHT